MDLVFTYIDDKIEHWVFEDVIANQYFMYDNENDFYALLNATKGIFHTYRTKKVLDIMSMTAHNTCKTFHEIPPSKKMQPKRPVRKRPN